MGLARVGAIVGYWLVCALALGAVSTNPVASPTDSLRSDLTKLRAEPAGAGRWIQESRLLFYLAEAISDPKEQMAAYVEGRDLAQKARAVDMKSPAAILWWAANHGGVARLKRNLWSLGALKEIEAALQELKSMDPAYGYAAAARVLGKIYMEAPGFVSIGSSSKAKEHMLESLARFPDFPGNEIGYAEWLLDDGAKDKATVIVDRLRQPGALEKGQYGDFEPERGLWRRRLDDLLRKVRGDLP